ncbi:MAG: hypothetical protein Hens3KO_03560 [Henriciella sp.]
MGLSAGNQHNDSDIRLALRRQKLQRFDEDANSLVIDELGLAHARSRIDVAVLNGCLHGYEIKSERDTLDRLQRQLETYRRTLSRLTYVCSSKHVARTLEETPQWCGVIEAKRGQRGGVIFKTQRRTKSNPDIEPIMLAHLLWRQEAIRILIARGVESRQLKKPRVELYEQICEMLPVRALIQEIRLAISQRDMWRDLPAQLSYGD